MYESRRPSYWAAREREWHPLATYGLLAAIVAIFLVQLVILSLSDTLFRMLFVIDMHWYLEPWTLVTSTLSHGGPIHLLFNGLVLFFFGPILERLVGRTKFLTLFFLSGAIAGVLQVYLQWYLFDQDAGGLGASGALMMVFGSLMVIMPHERILIWGIIPVPFWLAGIGFAVLDIAGAFDPTDQVGNFAHLSGMAIGLYVGWTMRRNMRRRGLRLVRS